WVGAEDRSVRFQTIGMGQGANMALPIYAIFLDKVFKDGKLGVNPTDSWDKPLRLSNVNLDCDAKLENQNNQLEVSEDDFF
ncbi:MAG: penicillin-binding protein, partial [Bacteroidetes bacterium HGW-Bacteroidetes-15]